MRLNPHLLDTGTPPIPEAKAWLAAYDGRHGPAIDLSQAVPGYPPPPEFLKRLGEAAASPAAATYGEITGDGALREAYAAHLNGIYGGDVGPGEVAITSGCNQAFVVAVMGLARSGEKIVLPTPWYFNHKMTLDMLGIEAVPLPCRADEGFVPRAEDAEALLDGDVRAICLVTPNNPTGAIYPAETIAAFGALCRESGVALILDETYRDFISPDMPRPHDLMAGPGWRDTVVQLYSFSKAYCIPGHRLGAMTAGESVVAEITKTLDCLQICPNRTPQGAVTWGIEALREWRAGNTGEILSRAEAFSEALRPLNNWRLCSIGAYFAFLEHPWPELTAAEATRKLATEAGVLALPGPYFGPGQERFLRVAFANAGREAIAQLTGRLAAV